MLARYRRGTSPRMRGKRDLRHCVLPHQRNIPAYAGKTSAGNARHYGNSEHPRVCGENPSSRTMMMCCMGTSPRMRGKPSFICASTLPPGNIPAYAGKTRSTTLRAASSAEHPRVCGENYPSIRLENKRCGTSPRMRGKPTDPIVHGWNPRNIPAYAGKTRRCGKMP